MGAIIGPATFVLGIVALISPIVIQDFSPFAVTRIFLIFSIFCSAYSGVVNYFITNIWHLTIKLYELSPLYLLN